MDQGEEPVDETSEVESESAPLPVHGSAGQGSSMQGSSMQGSSMQGSSMQGSSMQGSSMQGGTQGGVTLSDASVHGTAIRFWKKVSNKLTKETYWEYRTPTQICKYDSSRKTLLAKCTNYALTSSPLIGSTWPTTFTKVENGVTVQIPVTLRIEAVRQDPTDAMHQLRGSSFAYAPVRSFGSNGCENQRGCRPNTDIYNYDVKVIDVVDSNGQNPWLCPSGQTAIALGGTWTNTHTATVPFGTYLPSTSQFTFACTNGVIAKCTRWGYRPYDHAIRDYDTMNTRLSLLGYHSACTRAAMADYCGNGTSMTRDGTLVDVYDYSATYGPLDPNGDGVPDSIWSDGMGFIPLTDGFDHQNWDAKTAFVWEASFHAVGGTRIDHTRYAELATNPAYNIEAACPGTFWDSSSGEFFANWIRNGDADDDPPYVNINTTTSCAHSEFKVGKWMHEACSTCTSHVPAHCNDPQGTWDQACVDAALSSPYCDSSIERMSVHSECTTGSALRFYDSACTMRVCMADSTCCNPLVGTWSQSCVDRANATCSGGTESAFPLRGFCGYNPLAGPALPPDGGVIN